MLVPLDRGYFKSEGLDVAIDDAATPLEPITLTGRHVQLEPLAAEWLLVRDEKTSREHDTENPVSHLNLRGYFQSSVALRNFPSAG